MRLVAATIALTYSLAFAAVCLGACLGAAVKTEPDCCATEGFTAPSADCCQVVSGVSGQVAGLGAPADLVGAVPQVLAPIEPVFLAVAAPLAASPPLVLRI